MRRLEIERIIKDFEERWRGLAETRKPNNNRRYEVGDAALSAFAMFYMQSGSFLAHQRNLKRRIGRSNASSLFRSKTHPCDQQIKNILDPLEETEWQADFGYLLNRVKEGGQLEGFKDVGDTLLIVLDGTEYFNSKEIQCGRCLEHRDSKGQVHYVHQAILPVVVKPGRSEVLALMPEMIVKQDGSHKQDCEINAAKRWLAREYGQFEAKSVTYLCDALYAHEPLCREISERYQQFFGMGVKPDSHAWLFEWLEYAAKIDALHQQVERARVGKYHETSEYRWAEQVPLTSTKNALQVNYLEVRVTRDETGECVYHNSWITNHTGIDAANVARFAAACRSRWNAENGSHNVLKQHGYHLEHNFGHGQYNLSAVLLTLNVLAFLVHTVQQLVDPVYIKLRAELVTRKAYFETLRTLTSFHLFDSWHAFFQFIFHGLDLAFTDLVGFVPAAPS